MTNHDLILNGLRIHYVEGGAGETVVCLHGTALDSAQLSYGPSLPYFSEHYHVLAPDWPGYGKSELPRKALTINDHVALLKTFMDTLELEHVHLVGFSMGGAVALAFALEAPQRVKSLSLAGSYGLAKQVHVPLLPYLALRTPLLSRTVMSSLRLSRTLTGLVLRFLVFADPRKVDRMLINDVYTHLKSPHAEEAFLAWIKGEVGPVHLSTSYQDSYEQLEIPTLLLHGKRDLVIPAHFAKRAAKNLKNANLKLIPNCGHWLMREKPELFKKAVLEHIHLVEHKKTALEASSAVS